MGIFFIWMLHNTFSNVIMYFLLRKTAITVTQVSCVSCTCFKLKSAAHNLHPAPCCVAHIIRNVCMYVRMARGISWATRTRVHTIMLIRTESFGFSFSSMLLMVYAKYRQIKTELNTLVLFELNSYFLLVYLVRSFLLGVIFAKYFIALNASELYKSEK